MINSINPNLITPQKENKTENILQKKNELKQENIGVKVELGQKQAKSTTYSKLNTIDTNKIEALKQQAEGALGSLRKLVNQLISQQGKAYNKVSFKKIKVTQEDVAEAQKLISENGELGVKKTAERIIEFAKAISGGDKEKIGEIRTAIKQGFKEAEKVLGGLPEISQKTYEAVITDLDKWENEA